MPGGMISVSKIVTTWICKSISWMQCQEDLVFVKHLPLQGQAWVGLLRFCGKRMKNKTWNLSRVDIFCRKHEIWMLQPGCFIEFFSFRKNLSRPWYDFSAKWWFSLLRVEIDQKVFVRSCHLTGVQVGQLVWTEYLRLLFAPWFDNRYREVSEIFSWLFWWNLKILAEIEAGCSVLIFFKADFVEIVICSTEKF